MNERQYPTVPTRRDLRTGLSDTYVILFGVVLLAGSILVELVTHICASTFFNPLQTVWHVLLIGFVPLSNLLVWLAVKKGRTQHRTRLEWMNALAIGIAFFYTLLFLPLLPISVMAILVMGLGLCSLSPLFSLIAAIMLRCQLRNVITKEMPVKGYRLWTGIAAGIALLTAIEFPSAVTRLGLEMANSTSRAVSVRGVRLLRRYGSEDALLRVCYHRSGAPMDFISMLLALGDPVQPEDARKIYYRVTGRPFNSVPPPQIVSIARDWDFDFDFDSELGGETVGGRVKGLSLTSSRLDGSLDPDAALAYVEWTLVFKNDSAWQREARAQIVLPTGGVVSRLTLWVNGEEREAAFAGRGKVREAYQQVVHQRRDPVIVTTSGPDRVMMQCFPVPPNGGEMKVRIGITAPLVSESDEQTALRLPYFCERNFNVPDETHHSVWVESKEALRLTTKNLKSERTTNGIYAVRGTVSNAELSEPQTTIYSRSIVASLSWTKDPVDPDRDVVCQTREKNCGMPSGPQYIVLVVDGSRSMAEFLPEISGVLTKLPKRFAERLLLAGDEVIELSAEQLRKAKCIGGSDNTAALLRAWDVAAEKYNSAIVWIHGPQPILLGTADELVQRWERRPDGPILYDVQAQHGPNRIIEKLDGIQAVESVPRLGNLGSDLERLFSSWVDAPLPLRRERLEQDCVPTTIPGTPTSSHLARLWARDEVLRLLAEKKRDDAIKLAAAYHLVTPATGAVALETQQQYQQAGLQPVDANSVPTIPEPETWALMIVVGIVLTWAVYRRKSRCRTA